MGVPAVIIHFYRIVHYNHYKPSIWGTPIHGNPNYWAGTSMDISAGDWSFRGLRLAEASRSQHGGYTLCNQTALRFMRKSSTDLEMDLSVSRFVHCPCLIHTPGMKISHTVRHSGALCSVNPSMFRSISATNVESNRDYVSEHEGFIMTYPQLWHQPWPYGPLLVGKWWTMRTWELSHQTNPKGQVQGGF